MVQLDFPIAIIAGGKSTRFGSQKLDFLCKGKSLIEHSVEIASQISDDIFIIKGKQDFTLNKQVIVFEDLVSECGPIGGIYTALKKIDSDWLAVMPADMPNLLPFVYKLLSDNRKDEKPVVAVSRSGIEPLVSVWPAASLDLINDQIRTKNYKLHDALKKLNAIEFVPSEIDRKIESKVFFNINSQSDLDQID